MKFFLGSTALLSCEYNYVRVGENNRKVGQSTTTFSITDEKLAYRYFFRMSDEESRNAHKRMWKITSGNFIAGPREARNPNLDSDQRIASHVCAPRL